MNLIQVLIVAVLGVLGMVLVLGFTWLAWTGVIEGLRALATWILAREAERVMSLEPGPERGDRSKRLLAGLSRFDAGTSALYIPSARQRIVLLVAYVLVITVCALVVTRLHLP